MFIRGLQVNSFHIQQDGAAWAVTFGLCSADPFVLRSAQRVGCPSFQLLNFRRAMNCFNLSPHSCCFVADHALLCRSGV